jgi:peptidoglycan/LPS O-acetylase OafA/YrhL
LFSVKSLSWFYLGNESLLYRAISITRFHCMMIGAIGAILYFDFNSKFLKIVDNKYSQVTSWMVFFLMGFGALRIPAPLGQEVIAFVSLIIIIGQIQIENRLINLENKIANFLGRIPYGIYVIHPLVIFFVSRLFGRFIINNVIVKYFPIYSIVIALTIFISLFHIVFLRVHF